MVISKSNVKYDAEKVISLYLSQLKEHLPVKTHDITHDLKSCGTEWEEKCKFVDSHSHLVKFVNQYRLGVTESCCNYSN